MLCFEDLEEGISKGSFTAFALAGDRDGFVGTGRGLVLDEVFEVVVVNVVCVAQVVSRESGVCIGDGYSQCPHSGMDLWRSVSPYFMPAIDDAAQPWERQSGGPARLFVLWRGELAEQSDLGAR